MIPRTRRGHLESEQPVHVGEDVFLVVGDRERPDALAERPYFSDELVRLGIGDEHVRNRQRGHIDAAAIRVYPGIMRADA